MFMWWKKSAIQTVSVIHTTYFFLFKLKEYECAATLRQKRVIT